MAELFKIHYRVYQVINQIFPPLFKHFAKKQEQTTIEKNKEKKPNINVKLWSQLDVVGFQWIRCAFSIDLLHTIIETYTTPQQAWDILDNIFPDKS